VRHRESNQSPPPPSRHRRRPPATGRRHRSRARHHPPQPSVLSFATLLDKTEKRKELKSRTKLHVAKRRNPVPDDRDHAKKRQRGEPAAPAAPGTTGREWVEGHRIRLPQDAAARLQQAMLPGASAKRYVLWWSLLRQAQSEDEQKLQYGGKKWMPWITTAQHINRTGFSCLKVGNALVIANLGTANQLRNRRVGLWV
jgi:hypothetical protein